MQFPIGDFPVFMFGYPTHRLDPPDIGSASLRFKTRWTKCFLRNSMWGGSALTPRTGLCRLLAPKPFMVSAQYDDCAPFF